MIKTITKLHRKMQAFFVIAFIAVFLLIVVGSCFAIDFKEEFNNPLDLTIWHPNGDLNYSLTDNPGNLRIYFNGLHGGRSFQYTFFGKQWVLETKVNYIMNPLASYVGSPAPGQEFGGALAVTYVVAGGKGFDLAARMLNGYTDTIIPNGLGWSTQIWNPPLQQMYQYIILVTRSNGSNIILKK